MTNIEQGLLITLIGMGLVFLIIIFLWGLMALMMRVTSGGKKDTADAAPPIIAGESMEEPLVSQTGSVEGARRAAAAAVAVGLAISASQRSDLHKAGQEKAAGLSPWQAFHRTRQLENRESRG
jgi:Na+-transporting methylmalonyl-CoA/oxaloacetate decarboxylase gamma subunit